MIYFGSFIGLIIFAHISEVAAGRKDPVLQILFFVIFAIVTFSIAWNVIRDPADEILDGGDFLLVKKNGIEEKIPLSNIDRISYPQIKPFLGNRPIVKIELIKGGKFGKEVSFWPILSVFDWYTFPPAYLKSPVIEELIIRVENLKCGRQSS